MAPLSRVSAIADDEKGVLIGTYEGRGDAMKALAQVAYQAEPKW